MIGGPNELKEILRPFISDPEKSDWLRIQLYEIYGVGKNYVALYEKLFTLPVDAAARRDELLDVLIELYVLMEDMLFHADELHKEARITLDSIED